MGIKDKNKSTISSLKSSEKTETILTGAIEKVENPDNGWSFLFNSNSNNLLTKFYACQSERVECSFDITDNYVEDNSAVHDHIGVKPLTFRLKGKIGDVAYSMLEDANKTFAALFDDTMNVKEMDSFSKISTALTPTLTNYMSAAMAAYNFVENNVKGIAGTLTKIGVINYSSINTWFNSKSFSQTELGQNITKKLKQLGIPSFAQYGDDLSVLYSGERIKPQIPNLVLNHILSNTGKPLTLVNDMGTWNNVFITNAYLEQKESRYTGDVVVELKQLRYTEVKITKIDYKQYATRYAQQRADEEDAGNTNGNKVLSSEWWKNMHGVS